MLSIAFPCAIQQQQQLRRNTFNWLWHVLTQCAIDEVLAGGLEAIPGRSNNLNTNVSLAKFKMIHGTLRTEFKL